MNAMASLVLKGETCFGTTSVGLHAAPAFRRNGTGRDATPTAYPGLMAQVPLCYEKNRSHHQTIQAGGSEGRLVGDRCCRHDRRRSQGLRAAEGPHRNLPGQRISTDFLPKIKLELVVADSVVDNAVSVVIKACKTGKIGDGKVFVSGVEQAVRIRTEEKGDAAL